VACCHFLTTLRALTANFGAIAHCFVFAHSFAIFCAPNAGLRTDTADFRMKIGIPHHEMSRRSANFSAGKEHFDMAPLGVRSAFFKTVRNELFACSVTLETCINALLHFVCHTLKGIF
jgi:hypothetical protein